MLLRLSAGLFAITLCAMLVAGTPRAATHTLQAATLFGGIDFERAQGLAVGPDGSVYVIGSTRTHGLATPGAFDETHTAGPILDGFVAKFTPDLATRVWCTYLGGDGDDRLYGVYLDAAGFVYAVGWTESTDFPTTPGAYQRTLAGVRDFCVTKLSADGASIAWSTLVGGDGIDGGRGGFALDAAGNVVVAGGTSSTNFPTTIGAFQTTRNGPDDAVVFKIQSDGAALLNSTLLGGSDTESAFSAVRIHSDGSIFAGGVTQSADFPTTPTAFQPTYGGPSSNPTSGLGDGFVVRLLPDLSNFIYSTYIGGSDGDQLSGNHSLDVDAAGRAHVIGSTDSSDFPATVGAFQFGLSVPGGTDGFVAKISADGTTLLAATYLGGSSHEEPSGIALDPAGNVYLGGNTSSTDYPVTSDAMQPAYGGGNLDAFLSLMSADLGTVIYSTFIGGTGTIATGPYERGRDVRVHGDQVYVSGDTNSPAGFPTTLGAWDTTYGGKGDAFVVALRSLLPPPPPPPPPSPAAPIDPGGSGSSGRCGSVGVDLMLLPALVWAFRRRRSKPC